VEPPVFQEHRPQAIFLGPQKRARQEGLSKLRPWWCRWVWCGKLPSRRLS